MVDDKPPFIGPDQAALIGGRVSIIVGTRDAHHRPHVMRAVGSRLSPDRRRLTVLLPCNGSEAVLADLRGNGLIAVVYSEPSTNQTLQVKGHDARVADCDDDDEALALDYLRRFEEEVLALGLPVEVAETIIGHDHRRVAVHFTVAAAFEQTPGPSAGEPLAPS